jgi:zinc resistance-associated protein
MKRMFAVLGIIALIGMLSAPLFAQGPGGKGTGPMGQGNPNCPRYQASKSNLTDQQVKQLDALHQKFIDETAPIRTELCAKKGELRIMLTTSSPDKDKALALQKEISELKAKMAEARLNHLFEVRKIDPNATFGRGHGRGGFGPHSRHGKGTGRGMGPCSMGG